MPEQQKRQKGKFELVQNLRQQIVIKREIHLEQARKSYSRVKAAQQELQLKRKRVEQVQLAVARQNHFKKVQKELQAIQHIDVPST